MKLVEATPDDLDALVARWYALARSVESYDPLNELAYSDVDEIRGDVFRNRLEGEDMTDYLIVHEDETIGFVTLREGRHPSREYAHYLRIVDLAVDEASRNRGHGTAVVERVKELARDRGCDHLKSRASGRTRTPDASTGTRGFDPSKSSSRNPWSDRGSRAYFEIHRGSVVRDAHGPTDDTGSGYSNSAELSRGW